MSVARRAGVTGYGVPVRNGSAAISTLTCGIGRMTDVAAAHAWYIVGYLGNASGVLEHHDMVRPCQGAVNDYQHRAP
jgi:hypothetical protein